MICIESILMVTHGVLKDLNSTRSHVLLLTSQTQWQHDRHRALFNGYPWCSEGLELNKVTGAHAVTLESNTVAT